MGNQNQIFKGEHPAQRQFVPYVDGELTQRETTAFGPHLEACWTCRLRIGRIQESIASFMEFDEALAAVRFPSSEIRASFRSKLTARVEQRRPKPGLWDSLKSIQRFWAFSAGRIAAASLAGLLIVAILYQFVVTPTVSASELLEKASIARREDLRALDSPVMYQKLKVSERDRSAEYEVWSDVESLRAKHAVDNRTEVMRDYETALTRNGLNVLDPLSPEAYKSWSGQLALKNESVSKLNLPGGDDALELRTTVNRQREVGEIVAAELVVRTKDWHPVSQAIEIKDQDTNRRFEIAELDFKVVTRDALAKNFFDDAIPAATITATKAATSPEEAPSPVSESGGLMIGSVSNSNTETTPAPTTASAALEVEVVEALNNAGALTGEPVEVSRGADGRVVVSGMVETSDRKKALLAALANFKNNPSVQIKIETVAEVQARSKPKPGNQGNTAISPLQHFEVTEGQSPAYAELRKRFSDAEARRFADSAISRAQSARSHALAMKQISQRFSRSDLQSLTPTERSKWLALIRSHAETFLRELDSLRRDLQPIFPEASSGVGGGAISSDTELQTKVRELFDASGAIERGLSQSFALTAGTNNASPVKTSAFWRQFATAIGIAKSVAAAK